MAYIAKANVNPLVSVSEIVVWAPAAVIAQYCGASYIIFMENKMIE